MDDRMKQKPNHDEAVEKILAHIRTLDKDAQVEANHDMDRAIIGAGHGELALWLRDLPREAVIQARQRMRQVLPVTPKVDSEPKVDPSSLN